MLHIEAKLALLPRYLSSNSDEETEVLTRVLEICNHPEYAGSEGRRGASAPGVDF
jgi:hypothetical protein